MSQALKGATINGSGTLVATKVTHGTSASSDNSDHVKLGSLVFPVKTAINAGHLTRENGSLQELDRPVFRTSTQS
jgi:hypothetical protein